MLLLVAGMSGIMSMDAKYYDTSASEVYVCTSKRSKKYHDNYRCRGLQKCNAEIELITIEEAKREDIQLAKYAIDFPPKFPKLKTHL